MTSTFRVVTRNDKSTWIYRDDRIYCGPFPTRESALATVNYLEDGEAQLELAEREADHARRVCRVADALSRK